MVAFWQAAREEAPRLQVPFDPLWFATLATTAQRPPTAAGVTVGAGPRACPPGTARSDAGEDWGESPDVASFHGRAEELATLSDWVLADGCRLVAVLGMGGLGKTTLAARLAHELAPQFEACTGAACAMPRSAPSGWPALSCSSPPSRSCPPRARRRGCGSSWSYCARGAACWFWTTWRRCSSRAHRVVRYREGYAAYGEALRWLGETDTRAVWC